MMVVSLYYRLITDEMRIKNEDIGDVMLSFNEILDRNTGLHLAQVMVDVDLLIESNFKGMTVLNESYVKKGTLESEIKDNFHKYLKLIESANNELIIIDPYLLVDDSSNYINLLVDIIKKSRCNELKIITNFDNVNYECKQDLLRELNNITVSIEENRLFHDRYWISNKNKGFFVGSSLNGIGKKHCIINLIEDVDISEIYNSMKNTK